MKNTASAVLYWTPVNFRSLARPSILAFPMFARSRFETKYRVASRGSNRRSILNGQTISHIHRLEASDRSVRMVMA